MHALLVIILLKSLATVTLILDVKQFYKIEYYISMPSNDGRVMLVSFSVDQLHVPTYLPIAQQVIRSIQLA